LRPNSSEINQINFFIGNLLNFQLRISTLLFWKQSAFGGPSHSHSSSGGLSEVGSSVLT
jgi:hypothetical protein